MVNQREQIKISLSLSLSLSLSPGLSPTDPECVFITAVPIIKLFAWGEGDSGGHVLRETLLASIEPFARYFLQMR